MLVELELELGYICSSSRTTHPIIYPETESCLALLKGTHVLRLRHRPTQHPLIQLLCRLRAVYLLDTEYLQLV